MNCVSNVVVHLPQDDKKREELVKPTNPAAQKAALTGTTQYKVSPRPASKIKPRPLHSIANGKVRTLSIGSVVIILDFMFNNSDLLQFRALVLDY